MRKIIKRLIDYASGGYLGRLEKQLRETNKALQTHSEADAKSGTVAIWLQIEHNERQRRTLSDFRSSRGLGEIG